MAETTDYLIHFLLPKTHTRGVIIAANHIARRAAEAHGLSAEPAQLFTQTLISSILLLSINKAGIRQVLQLDAQTHEPTPIQRVLAEARVGQVRGYITWKDGDVLCRNTETPHPHAISQWMGAALHVSTVRDLGIGQPYISTISSEHDFLADYMVHYLQQSVQTKADIVLHGNTAIMLEAMPGADDTAWFDSVSALAAISNECIESQSPEDILQAFHGLGCQVLSREPYTYHCDCSEDKMRNILENMHRESLLELRDNEGLVSISCQYCDRAYRIDPETFPSPSS